MDWTLVLFNTFGGIGLFLMGMKILSDGLQKITGDSLRKIMNMLTANRFIAIFVGTAVTAIIQSSSATTVMTVGFVNAGILTLQQAIGIIFGANVGTTITAWIVILPIVKYALVIVGAGVFMNFFFKNENLKFAGEILFGLGILFLGMQFMGIGVTPLRQSKFFTDLFLLINGNSYPVIILGVLIGTFTTMLVQSSSVTIGITIVLATAGLINFHGAVSLILGDNIGTTITAFLASIGGTRNARRTALAHALFNFLGVCIILVLFYPFTALVNGIMPGNADFMIQSAAEAARYGKSVGSRPLIGTHIALAHTLFNVTNVILLTAFIPLLARLCQKIIPVRDNERRGEDKFSFSFVNRSLLSMPSIAIAETEKELGVMAELVAKNAAKLEKIFAEEGKISDLCETIMQNEKKVDDYQKNITEFLLSVSQQALSHRESVLVGNYITFAHNIEKFDDFVERIGIILNKIERKKLKITRTERAEALEICRENVSFFDQAIDIFRSRGRDEDFLNIAEVKRKRIKELISQAKLNHFEQIREKVRQDDAAIFYIDILNNLNGMRAEAFNIAEIVTGSKYI